VEGVSDQTGGLFGHETTAAVLRVSCDRLGVDPVGAELLRLGENAIYRLLGVPLVVRVGRDMDHWSAAAKEVGVATWLADAGVAAARTWDVEQPIEVDGHPVTFWHFIDGRNGAPEDVAILGRLLRQFHELPRPTDTELPDEDVLGRVEPRIRRADIPAADREFLGQLLDELRREIKTLTYVLHPAVTHGDAHVQNLMITDEGPVIIDFERVAFWQPEWDLAVTATEHVTAGWWTSEEYATFVESYGFDVMSWEGFDTLRRVHEIKMTTWLMQNIEESDDIRREYEVRMETIRGERSDRAWKPF
jgi:aminoglycoside phosphotransferase (APT) family kinase protein